MKRNNILSREKVITKQDVNCSKKPPGFSYDKTSPQKTLIQWDELFQPWCWARRCPLHSDTMALAGAVSFLGNALLRTLRVFKKRQPGLETKHSSAEVNPARDAGMWSAPGFLPQPLCCAPQAFSEMSTSSTLPPRLQLALAVLHSEMRFARCPPAELAHTFPTGWEHVLWVRKYSHRGITFTAILPPACLLLTIRFCCSSGWMSRWVQTQLSNLHDALHSRTG